MLSRVGHLLFRYRNGLFPVACVLLFVPGPAPFSDPMQAAGIGAALAALGQLIRIATIGLKYVVRGGRGRRIYAEDLVTEGIYSHVRNPMYAGNLLIAGGLAVASNSWPTIALAVPLGVLMYMSIVAAEEEYLAQHFGAAFDAYCRDVPRGFPRFTGLSGTLRGMRFHWRRVLLKEYGTPFGWVTVLVLITFYNFWLSGDWRFRDADIDMLQDILIGAVVFWLIAWTLKRSRRLIAD